LKVLALSDFHGFLPSFYRVVEKAEEIEADLIVVAGDITHFGDLEDAKKLLGILTQSGSDVLFVPGNCDPPSLASVDWNKPRCLHGRSVSVEDLCFLGVGGALRGPFHTLFEVDDGEIKSILEACLRSEPSKRFVVVSHNPPKNTKLDLTRLGLHVGSMSLRSFIEQHKPLCVVCGHIHEARGVDSLGLTVLVNPGPARDGNYAVLELDDKVEVELGKL